MGADSGTIANVTQNLAFVQAAKPDAMLLTGDLTYADHYENGREVTCFSPAQCKHLIDYGVISVCANEK